MAKMKQKQAKGNSKAKGEKPGCKTQTIAPFSHQ
jgi:hypothetical protein